jgi:hypothetical protein
VPSRLRGWRVLPISPGIKVRPLCARGRPVDVLVFMTAQRTGGQGWLQVAEPGGGGVSARMPWIVAGSTVV